MNEKMDDIQLIQKELQQNTLQTDASDTGKINSGFMEINGSSRVMMGEYLP